MQGDSIVAIAFQMGRVRLQCKLSPRGTIDGRRALWAGHTNSDVANMTSALPFDDIRELAARLPDANRNASAVAPESGRLGALGDWLARWSSSGLRPMRRPLVAIFAGTHGIAGRLGRDADAVSDSVAAIGAGQAVVNTVCSTHDLGLKVFDLALRVPTADATLDAALDERACAATMAFGMEAVAGGTDFLCLAGLGDAADVSAAALAASICGIPVGGFLAGEGAAEAQAAVEFHRAHARDPLEILRRIGGRECAAIAGAILASRMERAPALLEGPAALAAALVVNTLRPGAVAHCAAAELPAGNGWSGVIDRLGIDAVFATRFEAPIGTAGALASGILKAAAQIVEPAPRGS
jgi:nicotinate-nucleotide--dimethylbenzimidazole phosphoribosyltransferase